MKNKTGPGVHHREHQMNPKSVQCSISVVFRNVPSLTIYSNALDKRYTQLYAITIVVLLNIFIIYLLQQGSTGKPKCVVHSHRGLANDLLQLRATNLTVSTRSSMIEIKTIHLHNIILPMKLMYCIFISLSLFPTRFISPLFPVV